MGRHVHKRKQIRYRCWLGDWFAEKEFMHIGRPEVKGATDTHLEVK